MVKDSLQISFQCQSEVDLQTMVHAYSAVAALSKPLLGSFTSYSLAKGSMQITLVSPYIHLLGQSLGQQAETF